MPAYLRIILGIPNSLDFVYKFFDLLKFWLQLIVLKLHNPIFNQPALSLQTPAKVA